MSYRPIPNTNYEVSNTGIVRLRHDTYGHKRGHRLHQFLSSKGYKRVNVRINGQRKHVDVHRLVAWAHLGPVRGKNVKHINRKPQDNRASNLIIVDRY